MFSSFFFEFINTTDKLATFCFFISFFHYFWLINLVFWSNLNISISNISFFNEKQNYLTQLNTRLSLNFLNKFYLFFSNKKLSIKFLIVLL